MDPSGLNILIVIIILLMLSAIFSASETAYSSISLIRLKTFVEDDKPGANKALKLAENFNETITTILVGNNIVNILQASLATIFFDRLDPRYGVLYSTVIITVVILIFGEILPKNYAKKNVEKVALTIAPFLTFLNYTFKPLTYCFVKLNSELLKRYEEEQLPTVTEDELMAIVENIEVEGVIGEEEKELIHSAIEFEDTIIEEIYTPRTDVVAIDINMNEKQIKEIILKYHFSRIPVYDRTIDNIIGIIYEKDYLAEIVEGKDVSDIRDLIRPPLFVSKNMRVSELLRLFKRDNIHIAIVLDEYGGTLGIVTMEDVFEVLVGEIWDEYDDVPELVKVVSDEEFIVDALCDITDFFENYLHLKVPEDAENDDIGVWVYNRLPSLPNINDSFDYEGFKFEVMKIENNRIIKIRVAKIKENIEE
ncbi:MAG TPA: HlyC/CorC family transporter [Tenericutes bacterium]|nr:HlyC/CorC family transporter [Mycoplasmatota bacterium]